MLEKMSIGTRLGVSFSIVVLLLLLCSLIGIRSMGSVNDDVRAVVDNRYPKTVMANEVIDASNQIIKSLNYMLLIKDGELARKEFEHIQVQRKLIDERLQTLEKTIVRSDGRVILKKIDGARASYREAQEKTLELLGQGQRAEAIEYVMSTTRPRHVDYLQALSELLDYLTQRMAESNQQAAATYMSARNWLFMLMGLAVVLAVSIGIVVTRSILRQLGGELTYAVDTIGRIAAGDLTHPVLSNGGTNSLLGAVAGMQEKLAEVVRRVDSLSDSLSTQAEAVATTSSQLGAASHTQSESTAQSAAAIEELTVSITEVSEVARHTESNSNQTVTLAEEGNHLINDIAREIEAVAATVTESSEQIKTLEQRSQDIGGIANVIKEIADQTNLLALNAAIEAARAGEQGRGFAVVADEVRKLAERTGMATSEIGEKIAAIQSETQSVVGAMQQAVPQVQKGLALTTMATGKLDEIHTQAIDSTEKVRDVANATKQQTTAATDIARNVEHIAAMAEQSNAAMSANAESAHALEKMSEELRQAIDYFRVA